MAYAVGGKQMDYDKQEPIKEEVPKKVEVPKEEKKGIFWRRKEEVKK